MSAVDLLYSMMVPSGNDAALTLAVDAGADRIERNHCIAAITQENLVD